MKPIFQKYLILFLLSQVLLYSQTGLTIEPDHIVLNEGDQSALFHEGVEVKIKNTESRIKEILFMPSTPNLKVDRASYAFACIEEITINISYDGEIPTDSEMFFPLVVMNKTDQSSENILIYHEAAYQPESSQIINPEDYDFVLTYYYSPSCKSCREFLEKEIPRLEEELGITIGLIQRNIFDQENMTLMKERLSQAGLETDALPLLDMGDIILAGDDMITKWLEPGLKGEKIPSELSPNRKNKKSLWLLIAGAGLLDGINPCAFSTLIFLLAYLGLRKRSRREILGVGISFSVTVFITYAAVGAGAFLLLRESLSFGWISDLLKWGGASVLILLALLSFRDCIKIKSGEPSGMTLQLSAAMKRAVHKSVRGGVRSAVPLLGACTMGFMVTIYELGCTGQIYLPTLYLMTKQGDKGGVPLLLLYNLAFIFPLLVVFTLAYKGLTSERLSQWFQNRLALVKLLTGFFFLIAGALILIF